MIKINLLEYDYDELGNLLKRRGQGLLKQWPDKDGYLKYSLNQEGKTFNIAVHRVVWHIFNGVIPDNMTVDHIDTNKSNNSIDNLQLLTAVDNAIKGNAREWNVVAPNQTHYRVYNLEQFARDWGLHPGHLRATKLTGRTHKGWYCYE